MIRCFIPIRTYNPLNGSHGPWQAKARVRKMQRAVTAAYVTSTLGALRPDVSRARLVTVSLTRIAPRQMDSDNVQAALKAVRDGVAQAIGIDDGDSKIHWRYAQGRDGSDYGVHIRIDWES